MNITRAQTTAIRILIVLLTLVILFHFFIIAKIVPYNIAWGGRLANDTAMYFFETISILINAILILVLLLKGKIINHSLQEKLLNIILWFFLLLFSLNTIGNLLAKTNFEKLFAILTFIFAVLIGIILKKKR